MTDLVPDIDFRPQIEAYEQVAIGYTQTESEALHYVINGVYARAVFIPAGQLVTGKIHKHESIGILAQGTMRVTNGADSVKLISAPYIAVEQPGIKRMVYTETDCTFITVHRTDRTEIQDIEDELVCNTLADYEQHRIEVLS
jgi:hypothetical protein